MPSWCWLWLHICMYSGEHRNKQETRVHTQILYYIIYVYIWAHSLDTHMWLDVDANALFCFCCCSGAAAGEHTSTCTYKLYGSQDGWWLMRWGITWKLKCFCKNIFKSRASDYLLSDGGRVMGAGVKICISTQFSQVTVRCRSSWKRTIYVLLMAVPVLI